jgi:hypothetical protein
LASLILVSCLTQKRCNERFPPATSVIHDSSIFIQKHDSIIHDAGDSTYLRLYLACISGKPVIQESTSASQAEHGQVHEQAQVNFKLSGSVLSVNCKCDSQAIYLQWYNRTVKVHNSITKVVNVTTNILSFWQKLLIKLGYLFLIALCGVSIFTYLKLTGKLHG